MIPKVVPARSGSGSGGMGFGGLVGYITGKAEAIELRNLLSIYSAAAEMRAVAAENTRCTRPAYHLILSWPAEEKPSDAQAFAAADHSLQALDADDHQAVYAVHRDRSHTHVHIALNRVSADDFGLSLPAMTSPVSSVRAAKSRCVTDGPTIADASTCRSKPKTVFQSCI